MRWLDVGRSTLGALLGSILAGACSGGGFTCDDDEQCTLSGESGVCLAEGRCAFPDSECASGLAYPKGAPSNGGACVPGEATGTAGTASTEDTTSSTGEASSSTTTAAIDTGPADSSGAVECLDPYEPNDDEDQAAVIAFGAEQGCLATWDALIEDALDADWFVLDTSDGACPTTNELTFLTDTPLELCVLPRCTDGMLAELSTCDGSEVELVSGLACCGSEQVRTTVSCSGGEAEVRVGIAASLDAPMCLPYQGGALQ